MGFFDEITKPFKNIGRELGKTGKNIGLDKWGPYALAAAPFILPGGGLTSLLANPKLQWLKKLMENEKLLQLSNSALGTAVKEGGLKYAMAKVLNRDNPELAGKRAFFTSFPYSWMKTGGDWSQMLGETPTPAFADKVMEASPATYGSYTTPGYEEYGQRLQDKWYGPGRGGVDLTSMQGGDLGIPEYSTTLGDYYKGWTPGKGKGAGWEGFEDIGEAIDPITYELSPKMEAMTIPGEDIQGPITEKMMAEAKHPLAGLDYMQKEKTGPSLVDRILKKKGDEVLGIGEKSFDPVYGIKTLFDLSAATATKHDIEEIKQAKLDDFYEQLKIDTSLAPNFWDSFFLKSAKGGIANLAQGGRIGYQPGGITGAGPMTPLDPKYFSDEDDFIFNEETVGPNLNFADEFEGFLDLAGGSGMHPLVEFKEMYENYLIEGVPIAGESDPLSFKDFFEIIQTRIPTEAARGGRMGYYGGGELNAIPGGTVSGPGTETSDSIPAQLSNNEFVFTADAVRAAGGGNVNAGAQQLYGIMNALDPNSAQIGEPPQYT